jgi:ADP-heptose:LPS heptosyltransferase
MRILARNRFIKASNWVLANIMDFVGFSIFGIIHKFKPQRKNGCVRKILIIRTDMLGDILITMPFIDFLKASFKDVRIDILVRPKYVEILKHNVSVSNILISQSVLEDIIFAFKARARKYDLVISPRNDGYLFNHLLSFLMNSKRRIGFAMKGGGFLLTDIAPWENEKSAVMLLKDLANALNNGIKPKVMFEKINLSIPFKEEQYVEQLLKDWGISREDLIVGLNLFSGHKHIWPIDKFLLVGKQLSNNYGVKIIFVGERPLSQDVKTKIDFPFIDLSGKTTILQACALMRKFKLLITVDSGSRHMANCVNTPVIVLRNGANSSIVWGRYSENEYLVVKDVACSPCGKKFCPQEKRICMNNIMPEEILELAINIIKPKSRVLS